MSFANTRSPAEHPNLPAADPGLLDAVVAGEARLTPKQGLELYHMPLPELGRWADARCRELHGDTHRTYVIDRNINYTNICTAKCTFCAFRRDAADHDSYTLEPEQIHEKIAELVAIGGTQILMQGGMNPELPLDWYLDLLAGIKERFPGVHVHAFSPPEMIEFVHFFSPPGSTLEDKIRWVMVKLIDAGLDSLPGGGGEIFAKPVRRKIGLGKCDAEAWLTTMYVAHTLGLFTSATMMFGHIEGYADRVHHMKLVREWQDRALRSDGAIERRSDAGVGSAGRKETENGRTGASPFVDSSLRRSVAPGHYVSFISWPFQRENTPLGRVPDWESRSALRADAWTDEIADSANGDRRCRLGEPTPFSQSRLGEPTYPFPGDIVARAHDFGRNENIDYRTLGPAAKNFGRRVRRSSSSDYLRTQAISRLFLDNIYSIGSSWVTMGPHLGQTGLKFGANDMGSVMMEENVVSSAGTTYCLDEGVLCRLVRDAGYVPAQRDNAYDILRVQDGPASPDLAETDWSRHRAPVQSSKAPAELTVNAS